MHLSETSFGGAPGLGGTMATPVRVLALLDDAELLGSFEREQSQSAFTALVERHQAMVVGAAFRRIGNWELAREVAQEVFTTLARKAASLTGRATLGGWLHQAALYQAARTLQRENRARARHERFSLEAETLTTPEPGSVAGLMEGVGELDKALEALSAADREVIVLHYLEDLSYPEMARRLGAAEPAVRQRVSRALERLGKSLRARGVGTRALMVLLAAVAVQSSIAIPAALASGALAALAAGGSGWGLAAVLASGPAKAIIAVLVAGSAAVVWEATTPPEKITSVPTTAPLSTSSTPSTSQIPPPVVVPNAPLPAARQIGASPGTPTLATKPISPQVMSAVGPTKALAGRAQFANGLDRHPAALQSAAASFPRGSLPADEASDLVEKLREIELDPPAAAALYTGLIADVVPIKTADQTLVQAILEQHFEQLNLEGLAGPAPVEEGAKNLWEIGRPSFTNEVIPLLTSVLPTIDPKPITDILNLTTTIGNSVPEPLTTALPGDLIPAAAPLLDDVTTAVLTPVKKPVLPLKLPLLGP